MSKYAASFQIGWMTVNAEGETPDELVREIERAQDLRCLIQMAGAMGTKKDQKEIRKLIAFMEKYDSGKLMMEDIRTLDVDLSAGGLKCTALQEKLPQ